MRIRGFKNEKVVQQKPGECSGLPSFDASWREGCKGRHQTRDADRRTQEEGKQLNAGGRIAALKRKMVEKQTTNSHSARVESNKRKNGRKRSD
eukprot:163564-Pleurochrysis_carterae.AAC.1